LDPHQCGAAGRDQGLRASRRGGASLEHLRPGTAAAHLADRTRLHRPGVGLWPRQLPPGFGGALPLLVKERVTQADTEVPGVNQRIERLRQRFEGEVDAFITSHPANRRYLTGFTGSAGTVVVGRDRAFLLVDFRYVEQAKAQAQGVDRKSTRLNSSHVKISYAVFC